MIELSLSTIITTLFGAILSGLMSIIINKLKTLDSIEKNNILLNERYKNLTEGYKALSDKIDKLSILETQMAKIPVVERDLKTAFRLIDDLKDQLNNCQSCNQYNRDVV